MAACRLHEMAAYKLWMDVHVRLQVYVNADLYRWNCDKLKWSKIIAPNGPQPRSAHQVRVMSTCRCMRLQTSQLTTELMHKICTLTGIHYYKHAVRSLLSVPKHAGLTSCSLNAYRNNNPPYCIYVIPVFFLYHTIYCMIHRYRYCAVYIHVCMQAVIYRNSLLIFGGEFTSPNQERFLHYKDLWRLDLTTWEWDCLPIKGGPTARSGHRMVLYKTKALLFGGFYDTGKEVK